MDKRILVVGLGVFGRAIATELFKKGLDVLVADNNENLVNDMKDDSTLAVTLDSTDERALASLHPAEIDIAFVTIGENFEANLLTSVLLKEMGVKKVISRSSLAVQKKIVRKSGIDLIITPEELVASLLANDIINQSDVVESYTRKLDNLNKS
ncbi:MAG: TrkA family potassium uptake protein [Calditrichaeota bacterium]|nr:TrkA family potassium uptake protein [Calditrichota bacterium]